MIGVDEKTGKRLSGYAYKRQAIARVLFTPLGSLVMLPEFGAEVIDLISAPLNGETQLRIYVATAEALDRWLRDLIRLTRVEYHRTSLGEVSLKLHYDDLETGEKISNDFAANQSPKQEPQL